MLGAVGLGAVACQRLRGEFTSVWPASEVHEFDGGILCAHAHGGTSLWCEAGEWVAVDGERAVYAASRENHLLGAPASSVVANAARWAPAPRRLTLITHVSGAFPLYYIVFEHGFAFSNRLRPLFLLQRGEPDMTGVAQFLAEGVTHAGRTLVHGIRRTRPGEVVTYDADSRTISTSDGSHCWSSVVSGSAETLTEQGAGHLTDAIRYGVLGDPRVVMLSGGWDSRTLLAGTCKELGTSGTEAYSHGDPASRELRIVRALSESQRVRLHINEIGLTAFDRHLLQLAHAREETVVFPHWIESGQLLDARGAQCVTAGVLGEVLGGHYGPPMLRSGTRKAVGVIRALTLPPTNHEENPVMGPAEVDRVTALARGGQLTRPPAVRPDAWPAGNAAEKSWSNDIDLVLARYQERGVATQDQLVEAYVTEGRGSQYIATQLRSVRAHADVAVPFASGPFLEWASTLRFTAKVHNTLNRAILRRLAPDVLGFPMAATLVPASAPLVLHEASRLVRRAYEDARWSLHFSSSGFFAPPRLAWVYFEFLRGGRVLSGILEDLRLPIWDLDYLTRMVDGVEKGTRKKPVHPVVDYLMKVYTVDLTLR